MGQQHSSVDAYVTVRLRAPDGDVYPERGVSTRTCYRTTRPRWQQTLELPLRGGSIQVDGKFRFSTKASQSELLLSVDDADVGIWGWLMRLSQLMGAALAAGTVAAYVSGTADWRVIRQSQPLLGAASGILALLCVSMLASGRFRSDDVPIGESLPVPIDMLMDQRVHTLLLPLQPPTAPDSQPASPNGSMHGGSAVAGASLKDLGGGGSSSGTKSTGEGGASDAGRRGGGNGSAGAGAAGATSESSLRKLTEGLSGSFSKQRRTRYHGKRNAQGGLGVLKVRLSLSERLLYIKAQ